MRCYHRTSHAGAILAKGFRDTNGTYGTGELRSGVFLSNKPLDSNEGAKGNVVLVLDIPVSVLKPHEWIEEGKPYREFQVPAKVVNKYGPPSVYEALFQGRSRAFVLAVAKQWDAAGKSKEATDLRRRHLPFLKKYGLLEKERT